MDLGHEKRWERAPSGQSVARNNDIRRHVSLRYVVKTIELPRADLWSLFHMLSVYALSTVMRVMAESIVGATVTDLFSLPIHFSSSIKITQNSVTQPEPVFLRRIIRRIL